MTTIIIFLKQTKKLNLTALKQSSTKKTFKYPPSMKNINNFRKSKRIENCHTLPLPLPLPFECTKRKRKNVFFKELLIEFLTIKRQQLRISRFLSLFVKKPNRQAIIFLSTQNGFIVSFFAPQKCYVFVKRIALNVHFQRDFSLKVYFPVTLDQRRPLPTNIASTLPALRSAVGC